MYALLFHSLSSRRANVFLIVYLPVYFQACKDSSPVGSGVNVLPYSLSIAPFAIVAGGTATAMNKYKPQNVIAWACITIGMGLQSTLHADSATRNWIGFQIVAGIGFGMLVRVSRLAAGVVDARADVLCFSSRRRRSRSWLRCQLS